MTCDRTGTGGWTTSEGLFVIVPSYTSLRDEIFQVNFLAHESQHFVDKQRFGSLPSWRLEYRAKLVELSYASSTRSRTLDYFIGSQGDDPSDAHSYANRRVVQTLQGMLSLSSPKDLYTVPLHTLQNAAKSALRNDTQMLLDQKRSATESEETGATRR